MLHLLGEALAEHDRELIGRFFPDARRHVPLLADVAQGKVEQLGGRFVAGEVPAVLHDLSQLHVQTLDGVGGVDDAAHFGRIGEERHHLRPLPAPGLGDRRTFGAPEPLFEGRERRFRRLGVRSLVNRFELGGNRFAVLPGHIAQGVANQMHDAGLNLRLREGGLDGFGNP